MQSTASDTTFRSVVEFDDFLVDEETGEVLEYLGKKAKPTLDNIMSRLLGAQQTLREWERAVAIYKAMARRILQDEGLNSYSDAFGSVAIRSRLVRTARGAQIPAIAAQYELSEAQIEALYDCAATLDIKKLEALAAAGVVEREAVEALVETKESAPWVEARHPRKLSPYITPAYDADGNRITKAAPDA